MSDAPSKPSPLIDTRKQPEPELRPQLLAGERYTSREFMEREWESLWTRTWQIGCLESEIPRSGDYVTHDLGRESLLFVRDDAGAVRGWYNICQHRGNRLVQEESGRAGAFVCRYHGWVWQKNGELSQAQDAEDFSGGSPCGRLQLTPFPVASWGGFVWFNLDPEAPPLETFLEPVAREIDTYQMDRMIRTHWITLESDCNWKVVQDNFCESYHIPTVHPALKYFLDDHYGSTQFDLYPNGHTRMLMVGGRASERVGNEEMTLRSFEQELAFWELNVEDFRGRSHEIREALQARKRELGPKKGLDFSRYIDDQLTDHFHYTIFPNLAFSMKPDGCIFLRPNPHPSDPEKCLFDVWYFTLFPDGVDEYPVQSMDDLVRRDDPVPHQRGKLGEIYLGGGLDEDASVFVSQQNGLRSRAWRGATLAGQERRVHYSHQVIDEYLEGLR